MVAAFNEIEICNLRNWQKDQPQNLMDTGCIGWSESIATGGIDLIDTGAGKYQLRVFYRQNTGVKEYSIGDEFIKE